MAKSTPGNELDVALDELYGASPAEFTARRDALAKRLKAAGDDGAASEIKGRRKPTQLAYVLNQLARRHGDDVAELVDVGRELARAQRKALRGEAGHDLRDAIARQRSVVAGLTATSAALMAELGVAGSGHLDEMASALRTAMIDPAIGALLEEGRLDKVPEPAAGFPGATTLHLVRTEPDVKSRAAKEPAEERVKEPAEERVKERPKERVKDSADRAEERRRAASEAKASALEARKERERAEHRAAARARAGAEAAERARAADEAERDADGHAAQAKKLGDEARSLAADAERLAAEAKTKATEAKTRAKEAAIARHSAERAATEATRAEKHAKLARTEADRAVKHARSVEARARK